MNPNILVQACSRQTWGPGTESNYDEVGGGGLGHRSHDPHINRGVQGWGYEGSVWTPENQVLHHHHHLGSMKRLCMQDSTPAETQPLKSIQVGTHSQHTTDTRLCQSKQRAAWVVNNHLESPCTGPSMEEWSQMLKAHKELKGYCSSDALMSVVNKGFSFLFKITNEPQKYDGIFLFLVYLCMHWYSPMHTQGVIQSRTYAHKNK